MSIDNLVGKILSNRYEVIEKIGTGGMASVFKAKDSLLNRMVAIKVLKEGTDDEKIAKNFVKEAQSAAALSHNNIVSVYDVGEEEGIKFIVMELVDGITLKEYIKKVGTLPWQEACDFVLQIGQGIGIAHSSDIIHRDIKPQNIIMTSDKILKVTDFGIARAAASDTTIVGGTALGSVHYISPEQARGSHTDERSDIYSLGVVLYEMLAGKVPFDGETPVTVALMHLEKEPVNVRCINMDIPKALSYVTMKAIEKEPSRRYKNIEEFLEDIHAVLAEEPLPSMEGMEEEDDYKPLNYDMADEDDYFDDDEYVAPQREESQIRKSKKKAKKQKKQKTARQKKEDRRAVWLAILTIVGIFAVAILSYTLFGSAKGVSCPDFTNMTIEEAILYIQEENLDIYLDDETEYTISDEVEEGRIVTHDPEPGKFIPKGSKIKVVVSIGSSGGDIEVPDVTGKDFSVAITKILDRGLTYVVVEEESQNGVDGQVLRQLPMAGTKLNRDDIVTIYVSRRNDEEATQTPQVIKKVTVPNLIGMGKEAAINTVEGMGLVVTSVNKQHSDSLEGLVIEQSPSHPSTVDEGSGVSIIISKGPSNGATTPEETPPATATQGPTNNNPSAGKTKQFTVKIPDSAGNTVHIEITANGEIIHSAVHNKTEGYVTVDVPGISGSVSVQAMIDGSLAAQRTINFD